MRGTVFAVLAVLVAVAAISAPAAAEQTSTADGEAQRVDGTIVLEEWRYEDGQFVLELRHDGEAPKTLTITESMQRPEGATQVNIRRERVLPGKTTLTFPAARSGGEAGAVISTAASVQEGRAVVVSTGMVENNPFSTFGGTLGLFVGVGLATGMALLATFVTLRRESDGVEVAT